MSGDGACVLSRFAPKQRRCLMVYGRFFGMIRKSTTENTYRWCVFVSVFFFVGGGWRLLAGRPAFAATSSFASTTTLLSTNVETTSPTDDNTSIMFQLHVAASYTGGCRQMCGGSIGLLLYVDQALCCPGPLTRSHWFTQLFLPSGHSLTDSRLKSHPDLVLIADLRGETTHTSQQTQQQSVREVVQQ